VVPPTVSPKTTRTDTSAWKANGSQRPSRKRPRTLLILGLGLIAILVAVMALQPTLSATSVSNSAITYEVTRGDLLVTITEQGSLESSNNTEIKSKVRGFNTVTWVIPSGTMVKPGDELVRLDTKVLEENLSLSKTNVHKSRASLAKTSTGLATAKIAIRAYKEGQYLTQLKELEKLVAVSDSNLIASQKMLFRVERLFKRGFVTELEVQSQSLTVEQAQLELLVNRTKLDVLKRYKRAMELETRQGEVTAGESYVKRDEAELAMNISRRTRAEEELANCVIKASRGGLVIYPLPAPWKNEPEITEGVNVRYDQVLLLMPDLSKMQIKVGIHEEMIDRVKVGLPVTVALPDQTLEAKVSSVASVTRPAAWWTGNMVKYDTIIDLPIVEGLRPGMTAAVKVVVAEHKDVLMVPVAAIVEAENGHLCWVKTSKGIQPRSLELADSNDEFTIVLGGLNEGDKVLLNPQGHTKDTQPGTSPPTKNAKSQPRTRKTDHGD
jgi:multidrug efflux pump subunit AcrA (membrane-fusion protein)